MKTIREEIVVDIRSMDAVVTTKDIGPAVKLNNSVPPAGLQKSEKRDYRSDARLTEFEKRALPVSERVVLESIDRANRAIMGANRKFEVSIHEKTQGIMVKVINMDTNEVIREIPPEKILDLIASLMEMAGLIVDERR